MSKSENQLITKTQRLFIAMLAFFPLVSGCASDMRPSKPPVFVPFEAQKAGSVFTTELRVVEHRHYVFSLDLGVKKGTTMDATMENARQLMELAGGNSRDKNGKPLSYGISIPLKLKISVIESSGERFIYDKEIHEEEMIGGGGGRGFTKLIDTVELKRGQYRINIQSLKDIPELVESPITFGIYGWPNTNPID